MTTESQGKIQRAQRLLLGSNATDAAGRSLVDITIDLVFVGTLGATAMHMGLLNMLSSLAFVIASLPAGHLVDKYSALRVLRIGLGTKFALLICLALLAFTGTLSIPLGMLLCTLLGICNVFSETSQTTAVPQLIEEDPAHRASSISKLIARLSAADQTMTVVIPAVAGTGFTLLGAPAMLGLATGLALLGLLLALRVRSYRQQLGAGPGDAAPKQKAKVLSGLQYLAKHRTLMAITLAVALANLGLAIGSAVEAIFIIKDLGFGELGYGLLASVGGAGGLVGAALAGRISGAYSPAKLLVFTGSAQALLAGCVLLAAFTTEAISLILLIVQALGWGVAALMFNIASSSWVVEIVPEELLGRVLSARRLFTFGAVPLGGLLGGWLGSSFGTTAGLIGWVCATSLAVLCFLLMRSSATR